MVKTRPELLGTFGMVATTHWMASAAGMSVLERGGNAFDAAACAGFVLQVVEPHLNGPGGDMPVVLWSADEHAVRVVCGQGGAPAAATVDSVRALGLDMIPGTGLLAPCVPGAFGGWLLLLERYGTWRLEEVLEPAIGYLERGFPILPRVATTIEAVAGLFREHWPESAALWLGSGLPAAGSLFRNPELASVYRRIAGAAAGAEGREAGIEAARREFYEGFVAEAIDRFVPRVARMDVSGTAHQGLLTGSDLAGWRATVEEPVSVDFDRYTVFKPGAWTQGPVFLQQLALLDGAELRDLGAGTPGFIHLVEEAAKLAFADREAWYGDPAFADVPLPALLSPEYNSGRRALLDRSSASGELRPGSPAGRRPSVPWRFGATGESGLAGTGDPTVDVRGATRGDTVHIDVVDRHGNMVSATPSGGWLQSSPAVPGLGFCLGTRAQIFNLEPGHPNALAPGKRPRTTLSPSLAFREDEPWMAFGTPGADQQDQWSLNFFLQLVSSDADLQAAIDMPMWHTDAFPRSFFPHDSIPRSLYVEERLREATIAELRRLGHDVKVVDGWSLGRLSAVARDHRTGLLRAAANPRGAQGYAAGR